MHSLSGAQIAYLHAIEKLSGKTTAVRTAHIAKELHVTRASAHKMLKRLEEQGFVAKNAKNCVIFTAQGQLVCRDINTKFEEIYGFFHTFLELDEEDALSSSYAFIGRFSETCVERLIEKHKMLHSVVTAV